MRQNNRDSGRGYSSLRLAARANYKGERALRTGTIKFYDDVKSFGFIIQDEGPDMFFHKKALAVEFAPKMGQAVAFVVVVGEDHRPRADSVRPCAPVRSRPSFFISAG